MITTARHRLRSLPTRPRTERFPRTAARSSPLAGALAPQSHPGACPASRGRRRGAGHVDVIRCPGQGWRCPRRTSTPDSRPFLGKRFEAQVQATGTHGSSDPRAQGARGSEFVLWEELSLRLQDIVDRNRIETGAKGGGRHVAVCRSTSPTPPLFQRESI